MAKEEKMSSDKLRKKNAKELKRAWKEFLKEQEGKNEQRKNSVRQP